MSRAGWGLCGAFVATNPPLAGGTAALVAAAEGRGSPQRAAAGIGVRRWDYAQSGLVWLYPGGDLNQTPQQLKRERSASGGLLHTLTTAHLDGVRGVMFWGERVLSWGRGKLESELVVWTHEGTLESQHSTASVRALSLRPDGTLAWVREGEVEIAPVDELLGD